MASKNSISNAIALVNLYLKPEQRLEIVNDAAGYSIHEYKDGRCERTVRYGLSAKEMQATLDGMLILAAMRLA